MAPCFFTLLFLISKRSAKSDSASMPTSRSMEAVSWLMTDRVSRKPPPTARRRITVTWESMWVVPVASAREVLHLVIGGLVNREHRRPNAVDSKDPARQKPGVVEEEAVGAVGRGVQIPLSVAHDELIVVEILTLSSIGDQAPRLSAVAAHGEPACRPYRT